MPATNDSYVAAQGAADILHVSSKTISRWAQEGKLSFTRTLGGHRRYDVAQLRQLAASLEVEATEERERASDG